MPLLDRHWWLRVLFACGASTVAVAYVVWCVRTALSIPPDSPLDPSPGVIIFVIVIPLNLFLTARYTIRIAQPSRGRARFAGIRGNPEVLPASLIVPHPERASNVSAEPLVIAWRPFTFRRIETAPLWAILILGLLLLLLITFFASVGEAMTSYHTFPEIFLHTMLSALLITLLCIAFLLAACGVAAIFSGVWSIGIATPIIAFFGRPFDVAADSEGITAHDLWGRTHHVRWDDARLLEVSIVPPVLGQYRVFTLYGCDSYVRWRDDTGSGVKARTRLDGITREEGSRRLGLLLDVIAAQTGLSPHTLERTLMAERRPSPPRLLRRGLTLIPRALACACVATASLFFPPVDAGALTLLPPVAYFTLVAGCLVFVPIYRRRPLVDVGEVAMRETESVRLRQDVSVASAVYTFAPRSELLKWFFISLTVCIGGLPVLFAWLGTLDISLFRAFRSYQFVPLWPAQDIAVIVGVMGVLSVLVLIPAVALLFSQSPTLAVQADAQGLHDRRETQDEVLAWDAIDSMTRTVDDEGEITYTVAGNYGRTVITWSTANALPPNDALPLPAVTPEQFAAIVAVRSGTPVIAR
ncbi:MAG: hypothetical protein ACXVDA_10680 [Ktedonobacterales bacterium]